MRLVIFGAAGPTGRRATSLALEAGHQVTAAVRRPGEFPIEHGQLHVERVDVLDAEAVDRVVAGHDAVVSVLGVRYTRAEVTTYSAGTANIVAAMRRHGLDRLVCVSSTGVSAQSAPGETWAFRAIVGPVLLALGRTVYEDMARMEAVVAGSGLRATVVRPAGLFDADEVSDYRIGPPRLPGRFTSRVDLADALVQETVAPRFAGETVDLVTVSGTPTFARMFMREAIGV